MSARPRFAAFTDGSSLVNPGGPGGTGFVVLDRSGMAIRFGGSRWVNDGPAGVTNNRMELRSVLDALLGIPDGEAVEVTSDSRYVIDALTKWISGWRRKGWRTSTGGPVMNRDLIEEIAARADGLRVRYAWVRGHVGHPVNEICDALASSAARRPGRTGHGRRGGGAPRAGPPRGAGRSASGGRRMGGAPRRRPGAGSAHAGALMAPPGSPQPAGTSTAITSARATSRPSDLTAHSTTRFRLPDSRTRARSSTGRSMGVGAR